ncbi:hypothetical protein GW17_00055082, partial [Ensete ventricosum]
MMHPLRFSNCAIRAKVFVRKIGFKLCVMRLNRVESFNAFAVRIASRRGWPWLAGRGSRLWPRPLARGLPATCKGRPSVGAVASGAPARDGRRRLARKRLPTMHPQGAVAPAAGVVAPWQGGCWPQRAVPPPAQGWRL